MLTLSPDTPSWDLLPCGLAIVDAAGQVKAVNASGGTVLRRLLSLGPGEPVTDLSACLPLRDAIRSAAYGGGAPEAVLDLPVAPPRPPAKLKVVCIPEGDGTVLLSMTEQPTAASAGPANAFFERRFRVLAGLTNDWFWSTDTEGRFIETFDEAGRLLVSSEVVGRKRSDFLDPSEDPGDFAAIASAEATRRPFRNLVYPQRQMDGTTRWISVSGTPQYDTGGQFIGFAGTAADVTRRHRAEMELRRVNTALEERVRARTQALEAALERYRSAEAEAAQANRDKSLFLSAVSHDLRQPLQAAITNLGLLGCTSVGEDGREAFARLGESLGDLADRVEQLLDVARIDNGTLEVQRECFPVRQITRRLAERFGPLAELRSIELAIADTDQAVQSDPYHCERILHYLLDHAFRAPRTRSVRVGIDIDDTLATVWVEDDGTEPFDRAAAIWAASRFRDLVDDAPDGGLALAIAERLARMLGHVWRVGHRPGGGTLVAIGLPLAAEESISARSTGLADDGRHPPMAIGLQGQIVVIEDDLRVLDSLCAVLGELGFQTLAATSLDDALGQLVRDEVWPLLVLADQKLGTGRTGTEAIAVLRRVFGSDLPAMILTGDSAALAQATTGSVPVLAKPIGAEDLRNAIEAVLAEGMDVSTLA
ncbi:MAG: PAS domain S-box protein [Rhodospirillaceae bacterium]|nr:PAS domain S-box protein [Rhodospirillaceae bacterium]